MRPLRILHVTPYGEGAWAYGGIPRVASAFVRQLAARGHDVTVCTTDAGDATRRLTSPGPHGERIDVRVFPNRSNRLAHDWQWFTPVGLHAWLREHARDFDVAHLHACRNLPGAIAAHHLRRYGVPYVLAPNGTAPVIERRRAAKHVFDAVAGRRMLREAAAILAVSDAERRDLLALGIPEAHIRLVPNPIDLSEFDPPIERGRFRRRAGLGSEELVVFLGKITPRKRLDVLVRAFAAANDRSPLTRLVIAGNDMGGLRQAQAVAESLGVADRLFVTGLLTGRERLELLADASVVVYPTEREVFGLVPLEAILTGTPVIVTGDSGCGEVITATGGGRVVPAGGVAALGDAIADVLAAPDAWRASATEAATHIRRRYGCAAVTEQLEEVYADALGERKPADSVGTAPRPARILGIIPAHNEAATLASVVADVRAECPDLDLLVVDDGSSDGSDALLPRLGVRWLELPERMGVGCAMRAGIRYARRLGYDSVVRLDGDGQHRAQDIALVLEPLMTGDADVVLGSRFLADRDGRPSRKRFAHRALGFGLSVLTGRSVTDPTSGFYALGPRAVRLLAEHHPTGYPEAELRLLLSRNRLVSVEVAVESRARMGGRTTLTPGRIVSASARVLLAMLIVPFRRSAAVTDRE